MKKLIGALAITIAALATTAANAESTVDEQRARLDMLWTGGEPVTASQTIPSGTDFTAPSKSYGSGSSQRWVDTYTSKNERDRAGR